MAFKGRKNSDMVQVEFEVDTLVVLMLPWYDLLSMQNKDITI